jgi:YebC/PmpR family DNA-binding regulatory protein
LTDNKNRTAGDVRHAFDKFGGSLGSTNCVSYLFNSKGVVIVVDAKDADTLMLDAIEEGAVDVVEDEDSIEIITEPNKHGQMREALEAKGYNVVSAETELIPDLYVDLNAEQQTKFQKMIDALEDLDDVQEVYHNVNIDEEDE